MAAECSICCNTYTKQQRKEVCCLYCKHSACIECQKKFILDHHKDPHCMNCNVPWNLEFLFQNFPKVFITRDMKTWREKNLFEKEKSMFIATLPYVEEEVRKRKVEKEIMVLQDQINALYREMSTKRASLYSNQMKKEKREFIRKCPADNCKGFLSTKWKCAICSVNVCNQCHEIKQNDEHVCNEDVLKSVKMMDQETRPCPSCASLIFKISGCDQMWCTSCHTTFSWKTGQIEKGTVHNPHYYEYLRKNGNVPRNIGDVPCGGIPDAYSVNRILQGVYKIARNQLHETAELVMDINRCLHHIQNFEIPRYPLQPNGIDNNLDLRINYLMNELAEDEMTRELIKRDQAHKKNYDHRLVFDMIIAVGIDLFNRIIPKEGQNDSVIQQMCSEFETLRNHANTSFKNLGRMYNRTVSTYISEDWGVTNVKLAGKKSADK